jgi:hypothetical protein
LRVLYDDKAEALAKANQTAQTMCTIFNEELAPAFGVEPITPDELEEYLRAAAPREVQKITTLARAKAEFAFGNRLTAYPLVAKTIRPPPDELHSTREPAPAPRAPAIPPHVSSLSQINDILFTHRSLADRVYSSRFRKPEK